MIKRPIKVRCRRHRVGIQSYSSEIYNNITNYNYVLQYNNTLQFRMMEAESGNAGNARSLSFIYLTCDNGDSLETINN